MRNVNGNDVFGADVFPYQRLPFMCQQIPKGQEGDINSFLLQIETPKVFFGSIGVASRSAPKCFVFENHYVVN
jgi:hypothetical protein